MRGLQRFGLGGVDSLRSVAVFPVVSPLGTAFRLGSGDGEKCGERGGGSLLAWGLATTALIGPHLLRSQRSLWGRGRANLKPDEPPEAPIAADPPGRRRRRLAPPPVVPAGEPRPIEEAPAAATDWPAEPEGFRRSVAERLTGRGGPVASPTDAGAAGPCPTSEASLEDARLAFPVWSRIDDTPRDIDASAEIDREIGRHGAPIGGLVCLSRPDVEMLDLEPFGRMPAMAPADLDRRATYLGDNLRSHGDGR